MTRDSSQGATRIAATFFGEIATEIQNAEWRVWIATPFIGEEMGSAIADAADRAAGVPLDRRLLVAYGDHSIEAGVLSARALMRFREAGFAVRSIANLHAKSVVSDAWAYLGSGNLTAAGLAGGNVELGAIVSGAAARQVAERFAGWFESREAVELEWARVEDASRQKRVGQRDPLAALAPDALGLRLAGRGAWENRRGSPSRQRLATTSRRPRLDRAPADWDEFVRAVAAARSRAVEQGDRSWSTVTEALRTQGYDLAPYRAAGASGAVLRRAINDALDSRIVPDDGSIVSRRARR